MQLTQEQLAIINSAGNLKINAVAGSGKTTTIIEYARTRPAGSKILYLVFNRSVKMEAVEKFRKKKLGNVVVETAHSLAYKHIVFKHGYRVKAGGYKTSEIAEMLGLIGNGEKHGEYIVANHINKLISCYCNSDKQVLEEVAYLDTLTDKKSRTFVSAFYKYLQKKAQLLLDKMDKGEIEITHDFYLKKFQLSAPVLDYDYILFDEGQDASGAMLDVFLKQKATKVIVGDASQQIYSWRQAVNSLEKVDFTPRTLSTSFRFGPEIAALATGVLGWKEHIGRGGPVLINGSGNSSATQTKAILARTNLGLLLKAIECVVQNESIKHIYFEGNINSYTYADEGASLYDVLNLHNGKRHLIKDKVIRTMRDLNDLEDYIKKTEDPQLGMMVQIVKDYGNRIHGIIRSIKDKHVSNDEKAKAELIFSTVHRSKGMEYDEVELVSDFVLEKKLRDFKEKVNTVITADKLNEEVNLLYVAITRARNMLHISRAYLPEEFQGNAHIKVIEPPAEIPAPGSPVVEVPFERTYNLKEVRKNFRAAYQPWDAEADEELLGMLSEGSAIAEIATHFGRSQRAIEARRNRLERRGILSVIKKI